MTSPCVAFIWRVESSFSRLKLFYVYINSPMTLTNPGETIFVLVHTSDNISNLIEDRPSHYGGRYSVVSIATRYGLEGPGIESWWG